MPFSKQEPLKAHWQAVAAAKDAGDPEPAPLQPSLVVREVCNHCSTGMTGSNVTHMKTHLLNPSICSFLASFAALINDPEVAQLAQLAAHQRAPALLTSLITIEFVTWLDTLPPLVLDVPTANAVGSAYTMYVGIMTN